MINRVPIYLFGPLCSFSKNRITVALDNRLAAPVAPVPVASSQIRVQELSRKAHQNGNILTIFGV